MFREKKWRWGEDGKNEDEDRCVDNSDGNDDDENDDNNGNKNTNRNSNEDNTSPFQSVKANLQE